MAQLLIRIRDRISGDPLRDAADWKRGDVIAVYQDDQAHGGDLAGHPDFRILVIPELSLEEAKALLSEQVPGPGDARLPRPRRGFTFDMDDARLPVDLRRYLDDDGRARPSFTLRLPITVIRALKKEKAIAPLPSAPSIGS